MKEVLLETKRETEEHFKECNQDKLNFLIQGDSGTGKTYLLQTARLPLYVYSFDPGGCTVLESMPPNTRILDTRYEQDDSAHPTAYALWEKNYLRQKSSGMFNHFGTVAIDSLTFFADRLMSNILKQAGIAGSQPRIQDYYTLGVVLQNIVNDLCNLPCDFVLTGHTDLMKDDVVGKILSRLLCPGRSKDVLPLQFSERYQTICKKEGGKIVYGLLTASDGFYQAKTRAGRDGKFELVETPNLTYLRGKAGKPTNHLPLLDQLIGEEQ